MEELRYAFSGYTYDRLKEFCRQRDIDAEGKKEDLVELLCADELHKESSAAEHKTDDKTDSNSLMKMMMEQMQFFQKQLYDQQRQQQQQIQDQQKLVLGLLEKTKVDESKPKVPPPTLQKMTDKENIENYLDMFENVATQQSWPRSVWPTQLAGLLTGKALAAYAGLPREVSNNYDAVKAAILRRYDVNAETYRQRFRNTRRRGFETYKEMADRSQDLYNKWKEASSISTDEMILIEHFMQSVTEDLRVWLKERKPDSLAKAAELADDYVLARKGEHRVPSTRPSRLNNPSAPDTSSQGDDKASSGSNPKNETESTYNQLSKSDKVNVRGEKQCYNCKRYGHLMYSCPDRPQTPDMAQPHVQHQSETDKMEPSITGVQVHDGA